MDWIAQWDGASTNPAKRQLLLIEFIEKYGGRNQLFDVKEFEKQFSSTGTLFVIRLLSAIKRGYNSAENVDLHLRVLLIFLSANDWQVFLGQENTPDCILVLLSILALNPVDSCLDIEQSLLVVKRLVQEQFALELFVGFGGISVVVNLIESTVNSTLRRLATSVLFKCTIIERVDIISDAIVKLFRSPRSAAKYEALSLCLQIWKTDSHRYNMLRQGVSWLLQVIPQLARLIINRPILYQYDCATYWAQLLSVSGGVSIQIVELMNSMISLRHIVGGTAVIDNDTWQFCDTEKKARVESSSSASKRDSRWSVIKKSSLVATPGALSDAMTDAVFANKLLAGDASVAAAASGGDMHTAQDPAVSCAVFIL